MSGQQERKFDAGSGFQAPDSSPLPQTRTLQVQDTAATVQGQGSQIAAMGASLSGFFGAARKAEEVVGDAMQKTELTRIDRENKALAQQARVDQKTGKPMDPAMAERQDYYGAYQVAAADQSADELSGLLKQRLDQMPLDGTQDPRAISEQFYKDHIGNGTGDRDYDDRLLARFGQQAQSQITQFNEGVHQTIKQNTTQTIITNAASTILKGEMNAAKLADIRSQIASVANGDTKVGDQLLFAAMGSVQNDGQATSVLKSMQDLGMDRDYPDQFNKISGEMLERTNKVKTYDAGLAVQNYHLDVAQERSKYPQGVLPPVKVAEFAARWFGIDSVHGVGLDGSGLAQMMDRGVAKEVRQNAVALAITGGLGTNVLSRVAAKLGESPEKVISTDYDSAISAAAVAGSPELRATVDGTGLVNPMASDAAAEKFADMLGNKTIRAGTNGTMSDTFKSALGDPLTGKDPQQMARAFSFYNRLYRTGLTKDELHRYFPSAAAENHFWGMQSMSQGNRAPQQIAKDLTDYPYDQKVIDDASREGQLNLAKLSGLQGKPEEIDAKIAKARNDAFLESADRKKWFGTADVGTDSNEGAVFDALLADQFMIMKRGGVRVDIDQAIKNVAGQTGRYLVTPTMNGGLQAYRDPFGNRGKSLLVPLNNDARDALSTTKGFKPIYALGAKVTNALGQPEDTLVTWAEDADRASKQFPGMIGAGDKLYLERQSPDGLSMVKKPDGQMVQFFPGQRVVMPITRSVAAKPAESYAVEGDSAMVGAAAIQPTADPVNVTKNEEITVPKDPKVANEFFQKNLGPGWVAVQLGFNGPEGKGWVLHYAPRVKVGETERDQMIKDRSTEVMDRRQRATTNKTNRGTGILNNLDALPDTGFTGP